MLLRFKVSEQNLVAIPTRQEPRKGSKDYLQLQFEYSDDWKKYDKVLYLRHKNYSEPITLNGNQTVTVPAYYTQQGSFELSLLGQQGDQRIPTNTAFVHLSEIGDMWETNPPNPLPNWVDELQSLYQHPPTVGADGNWSEWNPKTHRYEPSDIPMPTGPKGDPGYTPQKGIDYNDGVSATHSWNGTTLTITSASGTSSADLKGDRGDPGVKGDPGVSILGVSRTSGTGAPGTTDTYTISLSDGSLSSFTVYNGANGESSGDMVTDIYDPRGKRTDIFAYVEEHGGAQSDWSENDETSKAYVKNRPFYSIQGIKPAVSFKNGVEVTNLTVSFIDGYGDIDSQLGYEDGFLTTGLTYYVSWDGVEYETVCHRNEWFCVEIGGEGYPFRIEYDPDMNYSSANAYDTNGDWESGETTHTLTVKVNAETVTQIPKKFVPPEAFAIPDWDVNDSNDPKYIKNRPFYTETWFDSFRVGDSYTYEQNITFVDGVADWSSVFGAGVFGDVENWYRITLDGETQTFGFWDDGEKLRASFWLNGDCRLEVFNYYTLEEPHMEIRLYTSFDDDGNSVLETGTVDHCITIEREKIYVATISPEYLTEAQSDWDERDPESVKYVKNKPFGSEYELMEPLYASEYVWFEDGYTWISSYDNLAFEPGKSYLVEWDGKPYGSLVAWQDETWPEYVFLGGHEGVYAYEDIPLPWPGGIETPFLFKYEGEGSGTTVYACTRMNGFWERETDDTRHSIVISEVVSETITKIDAKYLPDGNSSPTGSGVQSDWDENDESSAAYVKNRPFFSAPGRVLCTTENLGIEIIYQSVGFEDGVGHIEYIIGASEGAGFLQYDTTYYVLWDDVEYECLWRVNGDSPEIGGFDYGCPFLIRWQNRHDTKVYSYDSDGNLESGNTNHWFSVERKTEIVTKIDRKYLPESVSDHNISEEAHENIRELVYEAQSKADLADRTADAAVLSAEGAISVAIAARSLAENAQAAIPTTTEALTFTYEDGTTRTLEVYVK